MTEAEIRVTQPQAEDRRGLPATTRSWERQGQAPPGACRGTMALTPPELERRNFVRVKPPSLWSFVTAAPGNYHDGRN